MHSADGVPVLLLSTDNIPERDRLPMLREVIGRSIAHMDIKPIPGAPLRYHCLVRALPGLAVTSSSVSPLRTRRAGEYLADGNDDVVLCISPTGGGLISHLGREILTTGDVAILMSNADASEATTSFIPHLLNISLPRRTLAGMVPGLEDAFLRPISANNEALKLLTNYLCLLDGPQTLTTPEVRHAFVTHVHELAALAIGPSCDAAQIAKDGGVRAARLHAIKSDILASLHRQELTLGDIALRHGVTPRYVQMLFESEGSTFSRFLLDQRLARAHHMLGDPRVAIRTISAIAFEAGFSDLSHFNRAFRRRYGESPSDRRAVALRNSNTERNA